jgi:hypothetical protein
MEGGSEVISESGKGTAEVRGEEGGRVASLVFLGLVTRTGKRPQLDQTRPEKTGPSVAVALG